VGAVIFFAVMLLIAWMVVIMPQQRRVRAHQTLVRQLSEGDEVMTTSGIFGTITSIDGDMLRLEVAPGVELRVAKGAIARRIGPDLEPEPELDELEEPDEEDTAETASTPPADEADTDTDTDSKAAGAQASSATEE
jgi:preprotein translocase subunit YajC